MTSKNDSPVQILSGKTAYKGNYIEVVEEEIRLPNGKVLTRGKVKHKGAVVVIPINAEGKLVMIKQFRLSVRETILEFPAGTLSVGEEPLLCAKREICEEVGFAASEWFPIGTLYPAPGFCDEVQHLFVAKNLTPQTAEGDEDEFIEVVTLSVSEVEEAIRTGEIVDGKTVASFAKAKLLGHLGV